MPTTSDSPRLIIPPSILGPTPGELLLSIRSGEDAQVVIVEGAKISVGSDAGCVLRIQGHHVRPVECMILRGPRQSIVRAWSDHVRFNGQPFDDAVCHPGDVIQFARIEIEFIGDKRTVASETLLRHSPDDMADTQRPPTEFEQQRGEELWNHDGQPEQGCSQDPADRSAPDDCPGRTEPHRWCAAEPMAEPLLEEGSWEDGSVENASSGEEPLGEDLLRDDSLIQDFLAIEQRVEEALEEESPEEEVLGEEVLREEVLGEEVLGEDEPLAPDTTEAGELAGDIGHAMESDEALDHDAGDELSPADTRNHEPVFDLGFLPKSNASHPTSQEDAEAMADEPLGVIDGSVETESPPELIHDDADDLAEPWDHENLDLASSSDPSSSPNADRDDEPDGGFGESRLDATLDANDPEEEDVAATLTYDEDEDPFERLQRNLLAATARAQGRQVAAGAKAVDHDTIHPHSDLEESDSERWNSDPLDRFSEGSEDDSVAEARLDELRETWFADDEDPKESDFVRSLLVDEDEPRPKDAECDEEDSSAFVRARREAAEVDETQRDLPTELVDGKVEACQTSLSDARTEPEKVLPPPMAAAAEEESIETYMQRLLQRSGKTTESLPSDLSTADSEMGIEVKKNQKLDKAPMTSLPPAKRVTPMTDLSAMRELANETARTAITHHAKESRKDVTKAKMVTAIAIGLTAGITLILSRLQANLLLAAGLVLVALSASIAIQAVKTGVLADNMAKSSGKKKLKKRRKRKSPKRRQQTQAGK